jgi:hypothetical protein
MQQSKSLKILDVSNMEVVFRGKQWDLEEDPCARNVTHVLERNEGLVTWLQPKVLPSTNLFSQFMNIAHFFQFFFLNIFQKGRECTGSGSGHKCAWEVLLPPFSQDAEVHMEAYQTEEGIHKSGEVEPGPYCIY